jgi:hypothetical protein
MIRVAGARLGFNMRPFSFGLLKELFSGLIMSKVGLVYRVLQSCVIAMSLVIILCVVLFIQLLWYFIWVVIAALIFNMTKSYLLTALTIVCPFALTLVIDNLCQRKSD